MAELDAAIRAAVSRREADRLRAIKALILRPDFEFVQELFAISERTLRVWIHVFNAQSIEGLLDKSRPGRPRAIGEEHEEQLRDLILRPAQAEIAHWTAKTFHGYVREHLAIEAGYSTVVRWLHEQDFRLKSPGPWPDRQDEALRAAWRDQLKLLLADADVDVWYMDEMGVEGDPRPRRRWAPIGEKTRVTRNGDHVRMNVTGLVNPRTGEAFFLEFTHNDRDIFQVFVNLANEKVVLDRKRNILICDNASWHKCKGNEWGRFEPMFLPPSSPDLNPIEKLWLVIKAKWFADFVAKDRDGLVDRLDKALNWAIERKEENKITCAIRQEF